MSAAVLLTLLAKSTAMAAMAVAALSDVRRRIIPNEFVLVVALSGLVLRGLPSEFGPLAASVGLAVGLLLALGELSRHGIIGGGDAKLIAAASLVLPASSVPTQIMYIALAGGVVAVAYLAKAILCSARTEGPGAPGSETALPQPLLSRSIPYGLAILLGTAAALFLQDAPG